MARINQDNHVFIGANGVVYALPPRAMPLIAALRASPGGALFRDLTLPGATAAWYPLMSDLEAIGVISATASQASGRRTLWLQLHPAFAAATVATEVRLVGRRG